MKNEIHKCFKIPLDTKVSSCYPIKGHKSDQPKTVGAGVFLYYLWRKYIAYRGEEFKAKSFSLSMRQGVF